MDPEGDNEAESWPDNLNTEYGSEGGTAAGGPEN